MSIGKKLEANSDSLLLSLTFVLPLTQMPCDLQTLVDRKKNKAKQIFSKVVSELQTAIVGLCVYARARVGVFVCAGLFEDCRCYRSMRYEACIMVR